MNESIHGHLLGSPDDTEGDTDRAKIEQFQLQKDNAENFEHNHEVAAQKAKAVQDAGKFREAKKPETFTRGFKPTYSGVREVSVVERGQVIDTQGKRVPINAVKAVPADTADDQPIPDFRGRGLRDQRLRDDLRPFALELYDALGNEEVALTAAARLMGDDFKRAKGPTLLMSQFLKIYPNLFVVEGEGTSKKVRRVRRRIRGKAPR
jgi:hypothetical protein